MKSTKLMMGALCGVGVLAVALGMAACGAAPTAADLQAPPAPAAAAAGGTAVRALDYEMVLEGDGGGCTKTWQEDRYARLDSSGYDCICNVTTRCSGATYYWSSAPYRCYSGSCQG